MAHNGYVTAPADLANLEVAVTVLVRDDAGLLLMIPTGDGQLGLPAGAQRAGESSCDAVRRVVFDTTGVHVEIVDLVGVRSDPELRTGDRQMFSVYFLTRPLSGDLTAGEWVEPEGLCVNDLAPSVRHCVEHALADRDTPFYA